MNDHNLLLDANDMPIAHLGMSNKTNWNLYDAGITTVSQLISRESRSVFAAIGFNDFSELRTKMKECGLQFKKRIIIKKTSKWLNSNK